MFTPSILGFLNIATLGGGVVVPEGFVLIVDHDGEYVVDNDGYYLMEAE